MKNQQESDQKPRERERKKPRDGEKKTKRETKKQQDNLLDMDTPPKL
jgi:hypothetical protein